MPTLSFSQSQIAAMKNVLADGRWTQKGGGLWVTAGPVRQLEGVGVESSTGGTGPGRLCPIRLPFILFSILSSIILCPKSYVQEYHTVNKYCW